jgi:hypothetical protein
MFAVIPKATPMAPRIAPRSATRLVEPSSEASSAAMVRICSSLIAPPSVAVSSASASS